MAKLKKCKHCGYEVAKNARSCPNCGGKLGTPFIVKLICIIFGMILMIAGCSKILSDSLDEAAKERKNSFSYKVNKEYNNSLTHYIEGTVTNKSNKDYSYVQIEFICYDKDGNNIGTAVDNTNNLLAKQTWKFKAFGLFTNVKADHCDFHKITSW